MLAAGIFDPNYMDPASNLFIYLELQRNTLLILVNYFRLDKNNMCEWEIFKAFISAKKTRKKPISPTDVLISLVTEDVGEAFLTLALLYCILQV